MTVRIELGKQPAPPNIPVRRVQRGMISVGVSPVEQTISPVNMGNAILHISTVEQMIHAGTSAGGIANLTAGGHILSTGKLKFQRSSSVTTTSDAVTVYWQVEDYI